MEREEIKKILRISLRKLHLLPKIKDKTPDSGEGVNEKIDDFTSVIK